MATAGLKDKSTLECCDPSQVSNRNNCIVSLLSQFSKEIKAASLLAARAERVVGSAHKSQEVLLAENTVRRDAMDAAAQEQQKILTDRDNELAVEATCNL